LNNQNKEVFIIDSNALITPYKFYYSFEIAPQFWDAIAKHITLKSIVILDKVFDEISSKDDLLGQWIKSIDNLEQINFKDSQIIGNYGKIMNYISAGGFYSSIALNAWAQANKADPWIIAAAMANNYTVITFETFNQGLNVNHPSKIVKIPNVCQQFNIMCKDLFYMMHELSIRL
jgi:hypothetical protein